MPGPVMANVAAGHPSHGSAAFNRLFAGPHLNMINFPVTLPTEELVRGLNECRLEILAGFPSALHLLTGEARAGRLEIAPLQIITFAAPTRGEGRHRRDVARAGRQPLGNLRGRADGHPVRRLGNPPER